MNGSRTQIQESQWLASKTNTENRKISKQRYRDKDKEKMLKETEGGTESQCN
jgi:hypothetical protein